MIKIKKNDSLIESIIKTVFSSKYKKNFDFTYHKQKYKLEETLPYILFILKTGLPWECLNFSIECLIKYQTIYDVYTRLVQFGLLYEAYKDILTEYFKKSAKKKLDIQLTDTTVIVNRNGYDKIGYSKYNGRKKYTKISCISDANGIPINIQLYSGSKSDSKILVDHLNKPNIIDDSLNEQHKSIMLADKGYDSKEIRKKLRAMGYTAIIDYNKRNTKDPAKIKTLTEDERKIYKNRVNIEYKFGELKRYRRIYLRYDGKSSNYMGFIYLACMDIIMSE